MKKMLMPGTILVLLIVIAVLVIRSEGEKTREAMRETAREQVKDVQQQMKDGVKEGVGDLVDDAKKLPGQILKDAGGILGDRAGKEMPKPEEVPGRVLDVLGGLIPGSKDSSDKPKSGDKTPDGEKPNADKDSPETKRPRTKPQDVVAKAFSFARGAVKAADDAGQAMLALDTEEEIEIGREVRDLQAKRLKLVDRPEQLTRIQKLAAPFLEHRSRKEIEYTFSIVDDPEINAFSIIGGYIYFHTGLLDRNPTDAELQGIIGHEVGHVDLKHCVKSFTYAIRTGEIGGAPAEALSAAAYQLVKASFSEEQEFEADDFAYQTMLKTGRSTEDSLAFAKFLLKVADEAGVPRDQKRPRSVLDALGREVVNHYRTHPPALQRLKRLEMQSPEEKEAR